MLPGKQRCEEPDERTDKGGPSLGADVAGTKRLADSVVSLEADGKDGQHRRVGHRQLHERHCQTWGGYKCS